MKKTILMILIVMALSSGASASGLQNVQSSWNIGNLTVSNTDEGEYLTDSSGNILGGPYDLISDYSGYPYIQNEDGSKILYDTDGTIIAEVTGGNDILPPANGIYAIMRGTDNMDLCTQFELYDYETRELLHVFDRAFMYYLEQQTDRMVIEKDGKYAFCDKYGNMLTDYIYDEVKQRFNPDYTPFPASYAIVVENGVEKYIDKNFNEIDLDNYNGEPFVTNCVHIKAPDGSDYMDIYELESGDRYALYDLANDAFLISYQSEYRFAEMNDQYIIVHSKGKCAVLDHSGNIILPLSDMSYSLTEDSMISYSGYDGDNYVNGTIDPSTGIAENTLPGANAYFHQLTGARDMNSIDSAVIVYSDGRCADLENEDIQLFLEHYWNFNYDRVISPLSAFAQPSYYIKLYLSDGNGSIAVAEDSRVIAGCFGPPENGRQNYVMYFPYIGNARNDLYTLNSDLAEKYRSRTRETTAEDNIVFPDVDLLSTNGCSNWAKTEIERAAANNLLPFELTEKYTENISREDFCILAYRMIATSVDPDSDSRMGMYMSVQKIMDERGISSETKMFTDTYDSRITPLSAMGIIDGMGDGTFAPDSSITREQAAAILYRAMVFLGKNTDPGSDSIDYSDESAVSDWAREAVDVISKTGIMQGVGNNSFDPLGTYTVEQAIATMLRLYEAE